MNNAQTLIAGFNTYSNVDEFAFVGAEAAPGWTPTVFFAASSVECAMFSVGASAGVITSASVTVGAGC